MVVRKVAARGCLADPETEVDQARERASAGDADWQLWVDELTSGQATLIDVHVGVTVELDDGTARRVETTTGRVWINLAQHPPIVAAVVAEIAGQALDVLARRLQTLGAGIKVELLEDMYIAVELGEDLLAALPRNAIWGDLGTRTS